jgi:hypothetical protein
MVRNGHGDGRVLRPLLHHDMAAPPSHLCESMARENAARPDSTRSLANLDLKLGYKQFRVPASFDFRRVRCFEKQLNSLL